MYPFSEEELEELEGTGICDPNQLAGLRLRTRAPVTLLTPSVTAVRVWVAVLSGIALFAAFRPWLRLQDGS
jgi:hypothetical protein